MELAIDTETTGLFPHKGCQAFMVTATSSDEQNYLWRFKVDPKTRLVSYNKKDIDNIREVIYSHDTLIFHHANYDLPILNNCGIHWAELFRRHKIHDTMLMSHAYKSSNKHGLKENAVTLLQYPDDDEKELVDATKSARNIARKLGWYTAEEDSQHPSLIGSSGEPHKADYWIPAQIAEELNYPASHPWHHLCPNYGTKDTERTLGIFWILRQLLLDIPNSSAYAVVHSPYHIPIEYTGTLYDKYQENLQNVYTILDMQAVGIPVKPRALIHARMSFANRKEKTLAALQQLSNNPNFNPESPIQLRHALFQELGFSPVPGKIGKAGPSTDKDVISKLLEELPNGSNIPNKFKFLLHLKDFRKEKATLSYLENYDKHSSISSLKKYKDKPERILHTTFRQVRTGTGRLSSENPNTTNVGKKDMSNPFADIKDTTRAAIFAEILGIDTDERFSLRNVFGPRNGEQWTCIDYDQFQLRIFAVVSESHDLVEAFNQGRDIHQVVASKIFKKDNISDVERTAAKAINFGLLFGAGPAKIELLAGVPGLYNLFMSAFPKAKKYLNIQSSIARSKGYVQTVGGYRLYVPRHAPYAASCYVIQGTEAEIVKRAMAGIHNYRRSIMEKPVHKSYQRNTTTRKESTYVKNLETRNTRNGPSTTTRRTTITNKSSESFIKQGRKASSRILAEVQTNPHFELLMMVHDELVFSSRSIATEPCPDDPKKLQYTSELDISIYHELTTIMDIMEDAGRSIGIPCKVDAKITTTDWATRHSLHFDRAPF